MPTIQNSVMPIPKNWQEFEEIVLDAMKIRFKSNKIQKVGRSGQKQNGVDIFVIKDNKNIGVQCKLSQFLDEKIITKELAEARKFEPELSEFYFCTTAPRDSKIQKYVWSLESIPFKVFLLYWDDIISDLQENELAFEKHFRDFLKQEAKEEDCFFKDFRDYMEYIIKTDSSAELVSLEIVDGIKNIVDAWIMPDLFSKDAKIKKLQINIIAEMKKWLSYMCEHYMHQVSNPNYIFVKVYPRENLEEIKHAIPEIRENMWNYFYKYVEFIRKGN